jgi:hypothetical protein
LVIWADIDALLLRIVFSQGEHIGLHVGPGPTASRRPTRGCETSWWNMVNRTLTRCLEFSFTVNPLTHG